MLKISDFAQLSRVSPRALRLYDRLSLLKPVKVDISFLGLFSRQPCYDLMKIMVFQQRGWTCWGNPSVPHFQSTAS